MKYRTASECTETLSIVIIQNVLKKIASKSTFYLLTQSPEIGIWNSSVSYRWWIQ